MRGWALVLLVGCASPRDPAAALALAGDAGRGQAQYQIACAGCHGVEGRTELRGGALAEWVAGLTDAEVVAVVVRGGGGMPAQRLEDQQVADVVAWLRATFGEAGAE